MCKRLIYIWLLSLITVSSFSQEKSNFKTIDETTYKQYLSCDWKNLIATSNSALEAGIDYYYLRLRLGIAYYSKKNYVKAVKHFEVAKTYNSKDSILLEYLYYSYKFAGFVEKEKQLEQELSDHMRTKLKISNGLFNSVYYEGGITGNSDYKKLLKSNITSTHVVNDQLFPHYGIYNSIAISHRLGQKISITHAYSNLYLQKVQRIQEVNGSLSRYLHKSTQNQYYFASDVLLGNNYQFNFAANMAWIDSYFTLTSFETVGELQMPVFQNVLYDSFEYLTYFELNKRYSYVAVGLFANFSNFNKIKQRQLGLDFTILPLGSYNFYSKTKVIASVQYQTRKMIYDQAIGFALKNVWFEITGTIGELKNYNESKGFIVYNGTDIIKEKYSAMILVPVNKKLDLSLRYNYIKYESWVDQYWPSGMVNRSYYPYLTHAFILGIKYSL